MHAIVSTFHSHPGYFNILVSNSTLSRFSAIFKSSAPLLLDLLGEDVILFQRCRFESSLSFYSRPLLHFEVLHLKVLHRPDRRAQNASS